MNTGFYTYIGIVVVWCVKYMFIPFGVAFSARVFAEKLIRSQPERQRKKRS